MSGSSSNATSLPYGPSLGLGVLPSGAHQNIITNDQQPTVAGAFGRGDFVSLQLDGGSLSPRSGGGGSYTYAVQLPSPLLPGPHQISAIESNYSNAASAPTLLNLYVLPAPVNGVTTADISSLQFGALLDQGYVLDAAYGTTAIQLVDGTLSSDPSSHQATVQRLYEGLLGRQADTSGLAAYDGALAAGGSAAGVADSLLNSAEYGQLHGPIGALSPTQLVTNLYQELLGRMPDQGGLATYTQALGAGATAGYVAASLVNSPEALARSGTTSFGVNNVAATWTPSANGTLVDELFQTGLDRLPDLDGLQAYTGALTAGLTPQQAANSIIASPEFQADHAGQDASALVTSFYQDGLGRTPDPGGLQAYVGALQSNSLTSAGVLLAVATSSEATSHLTRTV